MKKNTFILMAMTAIFGLSSCDKELFSTENTNKTFTLFATTETGTKTALSGNDTDGYQVFWEEDDQFYVYKLVQSMDQKTHLLIHMCQRVEKPFELISGAGTTSGTFKRVGDALPNLTIMALYPDFPEVFPAYNYLDGFYPTEQTYSEGNIKGFPMLAQIVVNNGEITGPISFKNMNGILRLTVKNEENVSISKITVCADQLESPITLDCSNGGAGVALTADGTQFHIAMPSNGNEPASYSNVSIYLTDTNGKVCCKSPKAPTLDIARSQITNASFPVNSKDFYSYTTGSKVKISGHEGIVVEIDGKKVIVATMNVGATSVNEYGCLGDKMNYYDACAAWSGWRLPTVDELTAFCHPKYPGVCGDTGGAAGCTGAVMWDIDGVDGIDLYLPLNENDEYANPSDKYWTGTTDDGGATYYYFAPAIDWKNEYFPLEPDHIRKGPADKNDTYHLVRLFHDLP